MDKKYDIAAVGESLIDFVTTDSGAKDKITMEGNAGGAVANVLAMGAKLGGKTALISKVGQDAFGDFLVRNIKDSGVDTSAMVRGKELTTLAVVTLDATGNRSFSFYRNQTADVMLQVSELDNGVLEGCRIMHFGSVSMVAQPARTATLEAVRRAKKAGAKISFDPNYRAFLWSSEEEAIAAMREGMELADYVKVADEEALMLTGEADPEKAALVLQTQYRLAFAAVTLGPKGCVGIAPTARMRHAAYDLPCVNTTGAGDAFWGAVLYQLLQLGGADIGAAEMETLLAWGNAAGSLVTTAHGAIAPQPTRAQIEKCIKETPFYNAE